MFKTYKIELIDRVDAENEKEVKRKMKELYGDLFVEFMEITIEVREPLIGETNDK